MAMLLITINLAYSQYDAQDWPAVEGRVLSSWYMKYDEDLFIPQIQYEYEVDSMSYNNSFISAVPTEFETADEAARFNVIYPAERIVDVYYDPKDPSVSRLSKAYNFRAVLVMPVLLIILYFSLRVFGRSVLWLNKFSKKIEK